MANLLKFKTPETVDGYISELSRRLRHRLPLERATAAVDEIKAHLTDRADELTAQGMAREEAEARATKGFGAVGKFARHIQNSAYEDKTARVARRMGFVAAAILWLLSMFITTGDVAGSMTLGIAALGIWSISAIAFLVGSVMGRRSNLLGIGMLLALGGCASFMVVGSTVHVYENGSMTRQQLEETIAVNRRLLKAYRQEIPLLEKGLAAYNKGQHISRTINPPVGMNKPFWWNGAFAVPMVADTSYNYSIPINDYMPLYIAHIPYHVPTSLRAADGKYIIPAVYGLMEAGPSAFEGRKGVFRTADLEKATRCWQVFGPKWLHNRRENIIETSRWIAKLEVSRDKPAKFNTEEAKKHTHDLLTIFAPFLLLTDFLGASIGRFLYRRRWRNKNRGRKAAS